MTRLLAMLRPDPRIDSELRARVARIRRERIQQGFTASMYNFDPDSVVNTLGLDSEVSREIAENLRGLFDPD